MAKSKNRKNKLKLWGNITRRSIVVDSKGNIKPSVYNQIKWYTQFNPIDLKKAMTSIYRNKNTSKAKGVGKTVRVGEVLNFIYQSQIDNFFFNMGISVDAFLQQVNAQLSTEDQIDRQYLEDPTHWTGQSKNEYQRFQGDLALPNGKQVRFNWDYDMGSSWSII